MNYQQQNDFRCFSDRKITKQLQEINFSSAFERRPRLGRRLVSVSHVSWLQHCSTSCHLRKKGEQRVIEKIAF